jgi:hypothetical protein
MANAGSTTTTTAATSACITLIGHTTATTT